MKARGELVDAEALAAPSTSTVFRWRSTATEGPFTETAEQLAGFFHIDVESHERAVEIAAQFAGPGQPGRAAPVDVGRPRRQASDAPANTGISGGAASLYVAMTDDEALDAYSRAVVSVAREGAAERRQPERPDGRRAAEPGAPA